MSFSVTSRHLFLCTSSQVGGRPSCGPRGGEALVGEVQRMLIERGATDVLVTPCACLGPCFDGPNAVVYPDGVWYGGLGPEDAAAIVDHLIDGTILDGKRTERPGE